MFFPIQCDLLLREINLLYFPAVDRPGEKERQEALAIDVGVASCLGNVYRAERFKSPCSAYESWCISPPFLQRKIQFSPYQRRLINICVFAVHPHFLYRPGYV